MATVRLTREEMKHAAALGAHRYLNAVCYGRPDTYGKDVRAIGGGWSLHIEGTAAEAAVAKYLGIDWQPIFAEGDEQDRSSMQNDRERGDVGPYQVRHTARADGALILHPRDSDDATWILVTGVAPVLTLCGFTDSVRGKDQRYWRTEGVRYPAFFVPQAALLPMEYLFMFELEAAVALEYPPLRVVA